MIFPYKPWSALLRSPRWKIFVPWSDWHQFVKIAQVASSFSSFKKNDKYFLFLGNWKDVGHNTHCWHWESCKYFLDHLKLASCGETVLLFHQLLSPSCRDKMYFTVTSLLSTFCLAPHWSIPLYTGFLLVDLSASVSPDVNISVTILSRSSITVKLFTSSN